MVSELVEVPTNPVGDPFVADPFVVVPELEEVLLVTDEAMEDVKDVDDDDDGDEDVDVVGEAVTVRVEMLVG